jgi:hypothetical protein
MALAASGQVFHNVLAASLAALGWSVLVCAGVIARLIDRLIILRMAQAGHSDQQQQEEGFWKMTSYRNPRTGHLYWLVGWSGRLAEAARDAGIRIHRFHEDNLALQTLRELLASFVWAVAFLGAGLSYSKAHYRIRHWNPLEDGS